MNNGVSKKFLIGAYAISKVFELGIEAENKIPYAISIVVICVIFKVVQGFIDWKNNGKKEKE